MKKIYTIFAFFLAAGGGITAQDFGGEAPKAPPSIADAVPSGINNPLPLELLYFDTRLESQKIHLQWVTAQELNTYRFDVEKSNNAIEFGKIGEVAAQGNSNASATYHFYDYAPSEGVNYYRLRMIDIDQNYDYSKVVSVYYDKDMTFAIYPNPTRGAIHIYAPALSNTPVHAQIIDLTGKVLESRNLQYQNNSYDIDLLQLPAGTYFVKLRFNDVVLVEKIIKA